jgi:hypothetical protein
VAVAPPEISGKCEARPIACGRSAPLRGLHWAGCAYVGGMRSWLGMLVDVWSHGARSLA